MINLTKDIVILKSGDALTGTIIDAISKAKNCVRIEILNGRTVDPTEITASTKWLPATIFKFFDGHDNAEIAPIYNESWVERLYKCALKQPTAEQIRAVIPNPLSFTINRSFEIRFKQDALLILHFLWHVGAALLPMDLKRPTSKDRSTGSSTYEFAASTYPELLAFVRKPFISHVKYDHIPDIMSVMPPTAKDNFNWYAWRMIRASTWYKPEDINIKDVSDCANLIAKQRKSGDEFFAYPLAPKALLGYISKIYSDRCNASPDDASILNSTLATSKSINRGDFYFSEELRPLVETWTKYQENYIFLVKTKGLKSTKEHDRAFGVLNSYLFEELPLKNGIASVPLPREFSRMHLEGKECSGFLSYLRSERSKTSIQSMLYKINELFNYLVTSANTDQDLQGFINPLLQIDYPLVPRRNSTSKPIFSSEHFPILLQFCYAIEAFTWYLAENIYYEGAKPFSSSFYKYEDPKSHSTIKIPKVIRTSALGFVPLVFYKNQDFDPRLPSSPTNRKMLVVPILYLPRAIVPFTSRKMKSTTYYTCFPILNYIQHNIVALETGIRSIHIRWLDSRTYDKHIDRSRKLDPICKLFVNTDKVHGEWPASVAASVIEVLDRQKKTHDWFNEPEIDQAVWYDNHQDSPFGRIVTLFPRGMAAGKEDTYPGPFGPSPYGKYFKRLIFSFDLFCRYTIGVPTMSPPE